MQNIIRAKNTTVTESIRQYIEKRFDKFNKYVDRDVVVYTTIEVKDNGNRHKVEVTIPFGKQTIRAEQNNRDMYVAIDEVEKIVARLLRKRKEKLELRYQSGIVHEAMDHSELCPLFAKTKTHELTEMTAEEACEALEMVGHPFYVYFDVKEKTTCAVYLREDDTFGQIIYK